MTTQRIRAAAVCVDHGKLLCVRMRDPKTRVRRLFPPGGGIEAGESAAAAAVREALEETGYRVRVIAGSELIARYDYTWNGTLVDVTTHFFRAELIDAKEAPVEVHDAEYHKGVFWLPLEEVDAAFSFHADIQRAVKQLVASRA